MKRAERLEDLRTIGKVTAAWLRTVGIRTPAALRRVGAPRAYSMVVYRFGKAANRSLLWALAGALDDRAYNSFRESEKARLCREAGVAHHR
jgi:DNA transformation protein